MVPFREVFKGGLVRALRPQTSAGGEIEHEVRKRLLKNTCIVACEAVASRRDGRYAAEARFRVKVP